MEKGFEKDDEGFDEEDAAVEEQRQGTERITEAERKRDLPSSSYCIFESPEDRDKALSCAREFEQVEDVFTFLNGRPEEDRWNQNGIALHFTKTPGDLDAKLKDFFDRNKVKLNKLYRIDADGNRTEISFEKPGEKKEEPQRLPKAA